MSMSTDDAFKFIFAGSGRGRNLKSAKRQMIKATGSAPEVMAKITGFTGKDNSTRSHLEYITRNGKVDAYDRFGVKLEKDEVTDKRMDYDKIKGRKVMSLMLSMPPDTDKEAFREAVKDTLTREFSDHDYIFVFHDDTAHPHAHIVVPMVNDNGKRIDPRKADIARYRETFSEELERNGVLANATPTQQRKKGMLSKVFGGKPSRKEPSLDTRQKVDEAWKKVKAAYVKAGDTEAVKLINQLAPSKDKQKDLGKKDAELGD